MNKSSKDEDISKRRLMISSIADQLCINGVAFLSMPRTSNSHVWPSTSNSHVFADRGPRVEQKQTLVLIVVFMHINQATTLRLTRQGGPKDGIRHPFLRGPEIAGPVESMKVTICKFNRAQTVIGDLCAQVSSLLKPNTVFVGRAVFSFQCCEFTTLNSY